MTFTEAAAQVLRLVGKPLHYKEITDVAIEKDLLSHVGKSPEVTMGARLAALVKKGDKDNPLVRVKPGVFALREWDAETVEKGLADRTPALQRIAQLGVEPRKSEVETGDEDGEAAESLTESHASSESDETPGPARDELERAEIAAEANAIFAPEDDDDEPLIGGLDDTESENGDRTERENGNKRRRRRKRRGRGADDGRGDDLPGYTVSDAPLEGFDTLELEVKDDPPKLDRELMRSLDRDQDRPRNQDREQERFRGSERDRDAERARNQDRGRERGSRRSENGENHGEELADALAKILATAEKGGAMGVQKLAELAQRRERLLSSEGQRASVAVLAALRIDNQRRQLEGRPSRFRISENRVALADSGQDGELARLDKELASLAERYAEAARRAMLKKFQELSHRAVGELVLLVLERAGLRKPTLIRRPGTHGAELHLAGQMVAAGGSIPMAVVIRRDGREVGRERVTELRGALHHYNSATAGWIITTGQVLSGAREEAGVSGAAPVSLTDGQALVRLCETFGVGMTKMPLHVSIPDFELLELLRG